jgi:hypothetical protein
VELLRLDVILIISLIITTGLVKIMGIRITGITKGHTGQVSGDGKDSSITGISSRSITIGIVPIIDMPGRLTGGNFSAPEVFLTFR